LDPVVGSEQAGLRPIIVISHDVFNERSATLIAVAVTSKEPRAGFPLTLEITSTKLPKRSWAKPSQVRTIAVERLRGKMGRLSDEEVQRIVDGVNEIVSA
jgi:mRNA interferase MazF